MTIEQPQTTSIGSEILDDLLLREYVSSDAQVIAKFRLFALAGYMTSQGWNKPVTKSDEKVKDRGGIPAGYLANLFLAKELNIEYPQPVKSNEDPNSEIQFLLNLPLELNELMLEFGEMNGMLKINATQKLLIQGLPENHQYKIPKIDHPIYYNPDLTEKVKIGVRIKFSLYQTLFSEAGKRQSVAKYDISGMGPQGSGWNATQHTIEKIANALGAKIEYSPWRVPKEGDLVQLLVKPQESLKKALKEAAGPNKINKFALGILHKQLDIAEEEAEKSKASQSAQDQINTDSITQRKPRSII